MKKILLILTICGFCSLFALADSSSAVLVPAKRHVRHRVQRHHAHKATKHRAPKHPHHRA